MACKAEAQLECIHVTYAFFARLAPISYAQPMLINKISASEPSRKSIKSALLVGYLLVLLLTLLLLLLLSGPAEDDVGLVRLAGDQDGADAAAAADADAADAAADAAAAGGGGDGDERLRSLLLHFVVAIFFATKALILDTTK